MTSERALVWLRRLRDLSQALSRERQVETLLPRILTAAIELTDAERGFLVRFEPGQRSARKFRVSVARGFDGATLRGPAGKVSRTVVQRVVDQDRAVVTTQEEDQDLTDVTSVRKRRVRSVVCVPMRLRGEIRGAIYLDHRFDAAAFGVEDLPCLEAFADQAALALETLELEANAAEPLGAGLRELEAVRRRARAGETPALPAPEAVVRFGGLTGGSPAMTEVYRHIEQAARTDAPVLITGESGVGKERVAREIHARSPRASGPFLCEPCGALSDGLLESELFGHAAGAFTGARGDRVGLLRRAGTGSLVLDEVADMSPGLQAKLLRTLQERRLRPVGAEASFPLECRVLATSHHDLPALVRERRFREDLYFRLDVLRIHVPPLRERREDVPALLAGFLHEALGGVPVVRPDALAALQAYPWPGNVRELENEARRLASCRVDALERRHLSPEVQAGDAAPAEPKTLEQVKREMVEAALRETGGNKVQAARRLGIARSSLYGLIRQYGLES